MQMKTNNPSHAKLTKLAWQPNRQNNKQNTFFTRQEAANSDKTKLKPSFDSFFAKFSDEEIFDNWASSNTLLELAQKLGFNNPKGLARIDYEYIEQKKTRSVWHKKIISKNRTKERDRYTYISKLSAEELSLVMDFEGVQTLSHLALHFMVSPRHGRDAVRKRILELGLKVKTQLYKGVHGVSETPQHWPILVGRMAMKKEWVKNR